jgi:hypothetical protein
MKEIASLIHGICYSPEFYSVTRVYNSTVKIIQSTNRNDLEINQSGISYCITISSLLEYLYTYPNVYAFQGNYTRILLEFDVTCTIITWKHNTQAPEVLKACVQVIVSCLIRKMCSLKEKFWYHDLFGEFKCVSSFNVRRWYNRKDTLLCFGDYCIIYS